MFDETVGLVVSGRGRGLGAGLFGVFLLAACGSAPAVGPSRINPDSVPSLSLLDGSSGRGLEVSGSGTGESCETVSNEGIREAREGETGEEAPEEHGEQIREVLNEGGFLNTCEVPASSGVELCVAVIDGLARGVTVMMKPGTLAQADCVADRIRELSFPEHNLVTVARTEFDPN